MATGKEQLQGPSSESLESGYETSMVSIKGLAIFVVCLVLVAAVIHAGMWYLMQAFENQNTRTEPPASALLDPKMMGGVDHVTVIPPPPVPRIQPSKPDDRVPAADLQLMFREEDAVFNQMGWIIDEPSHVQMKIPSAIIASVMRQEKQHQQQEKNAPSSAPPPPPIGVRPG